MRSASVLPPPAAPPYRASSHVRLRNSACRGWGERFFVIPSGLSRVNSSSVIFSNSFNTCLGSISRFLRGHKKCFRTEQIRHERLDVGFPLLDRQRPAV